MAQAHPIGRLKIEGDLLRDEAEVHSEGHVDLDSGDASLDHPSCHVGVEVHDAYEHHRVEVSISGQTVDHLFDGVDILG